MDNYTGLQQTLRTEQTLSPQMLQSLALLPMPITELKQFIQSEIESNPALEIPEREFDNLIPDKSVSERAERLDDRMDDYDSSFYENAFSGGIPGGFDPEASDRKQQMIENSSAGGESLSEHLLVQLGESSLTDVQYEIGELLIGNLDANGFYIVPLSTLFENRQYSQQDIETALSVVRSFDPYGICVPDFKESLILQARNSGMNEADLAIFSELVNNRLEQLKNGKFSEVGLSLGIPTQDIESFYSIIKTLTPFPGRSYDSHTESYIVPEFSIHRHNDSLKLEMNRANLPDLEISPQFSGLLEHKDGQDKEAGAYIRDSIRQARTLISQVKMRYETLYRSALSLMEQQSDFFLNGPRFLKTLTLKQLADIVGVHETTMSRLVQNKYVDTDWGLYPMKYFFSQGVADVSRNAVKDMIADILKENPGLSDQKISDLLAKENIKCARRTVAKYRAELNIDSSFERGSRKG